MSDSNSRMPYTLAVIAGALIWGVGSIIAGGSEAWDSGLYWILFYPVSIVACGYLGYAFPERPWRWCLALFGAQFLTLMVMSGEIGNLAPLGVILFGVLALPAIAVANRAARKGAQRNA